jgi:hypothetical protein
MSDEAGVVVSERPTHGEPRPFHFPKFERSELSNGLGLITVHLPGRALVSASLILPAGAVDEPSELGGVTSLMARALTEGTKQHDAIALTEASERLGASLHAEAGWDGLSISIDVPGERLSQALELAAEVGMEPTFPAADVERMRDERLNDLLQAKADPRRRADDGFVERRHALLDVALLHPIDRAPAEPQQGRRQRHHDQRHQRQDVDAERNRSALGHVILPPAT